jgi:hypothetical protein
LAAAGTLVLGQLSGWTVRVSAQGPMALAGKFEVSPTGAASYTIRRGAAGSGGMVLRSRSYNSQRNGLVGMGWHLEGLPSIGRCARTSPRTGARQRQLRRR